MRFRLRDVLMLMLVLAVYLTSFTYLSRISAGKMFGEFGFWRFYLCIWVGSFLSGLIMRSFAVYKARPIKCELKVPVSWTMRIAALAVLLSVISVLASHYAMRESVVVVSVSTSTTIFILFLMTMLMKVKVGANGVANMFNFQPWSQTRVERDEQSLITRLIFSRGISLEIPPPMQETITALHDRTEDV